MGLVKMSAHRCLAELKNLDTKIDIAINKSFIGACKSSTKTISGLSKDDFKKQVESNFDSVTSLISNRNIIKDAVIESNALTTVTIGEKVMTVAQAIERKNSIINQKELLASLKNNYSGAINFQNAENEKLQDRLEKYLQVVLGDKEKRNFDDIKRHSDEFNKNNEVILIDPKNINLYIEKLEKDIQDFETNVDYVLSESNAVTILEIELED